jgi:hypothetical protein
MRAPVSAQRGTPAATGRTEAAATGLLPSTGAPRIHHAIFTARGRDATRSSASSHLASAATGVAIPLQPTLDQRPRINNRRATIVRRSSMEEDGGAGNNGAANAAADTAAADAPPAPLPDRCLVAVSCTSPDLSSFLAEIKEIASSGADLVELRLDLLQDFQPGRDLDTVLDAAKKAGLPFVVTCRAAWEGGGWKGGEPERLATLKMAALKGAPFVDVEYKAAHMFFAGERRRSQMYMQEGCSPPFSLGRRDPHARSPPPPENPTQPTQTNKPKQQTTNRLRRSPSVHPRHPLLA